MRQLTRLAASAGAAAITACASAGSPPGGPPDSAAPQVIQFTPDSGTVSFGGRAVVVRFDETISDRGTGTSALEALVLISPRDGEPDVAWHRNRIAVRPRDGFRPNTAYSITIAPGITDLRSNRTTTARTIVFSTGPQIPAGAVSGRVYDWPGQTVARLAWVEALRTRDSAVFVTTADSGGSFTIGALNPGSYIVRGYVDQNANRVLDRSEVWDSVRVAVGGIPAAAIELLLARRDTIPARITALDVRDSVTLRVEFDKPLDPAQPFTPALFRVVRADSTPVVVVAVRTQRQHDSLRTAGADTVTADSAARPERRVIADTTVDTTVDTTNVQPAPSRPAPPAALVVTLAEPLQPAMTYRITVTGAVTLLGRASTATRVFTTAVRDTTPAPRPAAPGDTTRPAAPPRRR